MFSSAVSNETSLLASESIQFYHNIASWSSWS